MDYRRLSLTLKMTLLFLLPGLTACALPDLPFLSNAEPVPGISSVLSDSHTRLAPVNSKLTITTAHTDPDGVGEVAFFVDGNLIKTQTPPYAQTYFQVENTLIPSAARTYAIRIVAYSAKKDKAPSEINLTVTAAEGVLPVTTLAAGTSASATPTAPGGSYTACLSDAALIADVTIPDGTVIQPGAKFDKTWRIKNTGTCDWGAGYTFDLAGGPALGAVKQDVPHVAPGGQYDFTLAMTAPTEKGTYRSNWRLFDLYGRPFGKTFFAEIVVPQSSCQTPAIKLFAANPAAIAPGENSVLSWEVDGADSIAVSPGATAQVSAAASALTVSPDKTTTYTLEAKKGACTAVAQVTVTVGGPSCQGLVINRFEANPATIKRGQSSTLSWDVTGATSISVVPAPQLSASASALTVSPDRTTTYTLEAKNAVCTLSKQATVTVTDAAILLDFIAAAPAAVWQSDQRTLTWPGSPADFAGYARWLDNVTLQNGNNAARVLDARPTGDSYLWGSYAANISGGFLPTDQLKLKLSYLQGAVASSGATYLVEFAPVSGSPVTIGALTLDPNGAVTEVLLPLSGVQAGQQGQFILQVNRGTAPAADTAVWVEAKVVRP